MSEYVHQIPDIVQYGRKIANMVFFESSIDYPESGVVDVYFNSGRSISLKGDDRAEFYKWAGLPVPTPPPLKSENMDSKGGEQDTMDTGPSVGTTTK